MQLPAPRAPAQCCSHSPYSPPSAWQRQQACTPPGSPAHSTLVGAPINSTAPLPTDFRIHYLAPQLYQIQRTGPLVLQTDENWLWANVVRRPKEQSAYLNICTIYGQTKRLMDTPGKSPLIEQSRCNVRFNVFEHSGNMWKTVWRFICQIGVI